MVQCGELLGGPVPSEELRSPGCTGLSLRGRNVIPQPMPVLGCVRQNIPARRLLDIVHAAGVGLSGCMAISGVVYAAGRIPGTVLFVPR